MHPVSLRTLDLNLLKVFDVVMSERSLTRAAHHLSLTQPAVSNALRRLREALGDELLVRKGRNLEPTARGQELWPAVRDTLQRLQAALAPSVFEPATATTTLPAVKNWLTVSTTRRLRSSRANASSIKP
jgi:DNA-binding transcriptional LysR family regulator